LGGSKDVPKPTEDEQQIAKILLDRITPAPAEHAALVRVQHGEDVVEQDLQVLGRLKDEVVRKRQRHFPSPPPAAAGAARMQVTRDDFQRATRLYEDPRLSPEERLAVERVRDALVSGLLGHRVPVTQTDLSTLRWLEKDVQQRTAKSPRQAPKKKDDRGARTDLE
jgi:hypothetical protein